MTLFVNHSSQAMPRVPRPDDLTNGTDGSYVLLQADKRALAFDSFHCLLVEQLENGSAARANQPRLVSCVVCLFSSMVNLGCVKQFCACELQALCLSSPLSVWKGVSKVQYLWLYNQL